MPTNDSPRLWTPSRRDLLRLGGMGAAAGVLAAAAGPLRRSGIAGATSVEPSTDWSTIEPASEITWWSNHPGDVKDLEEQYIAAFNEQYPDIKIELVTAGANYDEIAQRFQAAAGTDELPDLVIASDVWWFRYMINGQIIPIDDLFTHLEVDTDDYVPTLFSDYEYEGQHFAAPYARSTPLFYYNRDKWAEAQLPDRGPETWAEFVEFAPALRDVMPDEGGPMGLGVGTSWSAWWFSNIIWGQGGSISEEWNVTLDTEEALTAGNFVRDMYNGDTAFAAVSPDVNVDFQSGLYGAMLGSTGALKSHLDAATFEVGTAFLPNGPAEGPNVPTGGTGLAIPSSSSPEAQLAAAMFLKFLTDTENTALFSQTTGYMPVRTSAVEGATMAATYEETPQFRTSVDQLQQKTRVQDFVRVFTPGGDKIITDGIEQLVLGGASAEDVFPQVTEQLDRAYEEDVKPYL